MTSTDKAKSADKISNPLHLLQTLTRTLNEHLADACSKASNDARKAHEKLLRQQEKLEQKLQQSKEKLASRSEQQPDKPAGKTHRKIADLEQALQELEQASLAAQNYIKQLDIDVRQTLRLAKGLERIDTQVTQALEKRDAPKPAPKPRSRRTPAKPRSPKASSDVNPTS